MGILQSIDDSASPALRSHATYLLHDSGVPTTRTDCQWYAPLWRIGPFGYHMVKPVRRFTFQADTAGGGCRRLESPPMGMAT